MVFKEIINSSRKSADDALVSISTYGMVYLNKHCMTNYFKNISDVTFLYDEKKKALAIKPEKKPTDNSYRLNYTSSRRANGVITARTILKSLEYDYSKTQQFKASWNKKEKLLEIRL